MTAAGKKFFLTQGLVNKYKGRGCAEAFENVVDKKRDPFGMQLPSSETPNSELER